MSIPAPRKHWIRTPEGDHHQLCRIHITPETQRNAAWVAFWRREAAAGRFMTTIATHCPCGMHIERCECINDVPERIAHEVTA